MNINKINALLVFALLSASSISKAQKQYIEEAIRNNKKSGDYYIATIPEKKTMMPYKIRKFCEESDYFISEIGTRGSIGLFGDKEEVDWFTFLPMEEKAMYEEMYKITTGKDALAFIKRYPLFKERIEKQYFESTLLNMKQDISRAVDLFKTFSGTMYSTNLAKVTVTWLEGSHKELYIKKIKELCTYLTLNFNPDIDFTNENQLIQLYPVFLSETNAFSKEDKNKLFYKILDFIPVFKKTVLMDYEQMQIEQILNDKDPNTVRAYIQRFPNSNLTLKAKEYLESLDRLEYEKAGALNTVYAYETYKRLFPKGSYFSAANVKISEIERKETLAIQQKKATERINETDDITKYIKIDSDFGVVKGNDLSFWQSVASHDRDIVNVNSFVYGKVKNEGKKSKKVKLNITLHVLEKISVSMLFVSESKIIEKHKREVFYLDLKPGESKPFLALFDVELANGLNGSLLMSMGSSKYIDQSNPYAIKVETVNLISPDVIEKQANLLNEVIKNGNVKLKKTMWQNEYNGNTFKSNSKIENKVSTPCAQELKTIKEWVCENKINMINIKCSNDETYKIYYWTRGLEKDCSVLSLSNFKGDGFYKSVNWDYDEFLGNDKSMAMKKVCGCEK